MWVPGCFGFVAGALGLLVLLRLAFGMHHYRRGWRNGGGCHGHGGFGGRHGRGGWRRRMLYSIFERIDATPSQEKAIIAAAEELRAKVGDLRGQWSESRKKAAGAMKSEVLTPEEAGSVFEPVGAHTNEIRTAAAEALRKIHDVLDARQREILAGLLENPWMGRHAW